MFSEACVLNFKMQLQNVMRYSIEDGLDADVLDSLGEEPAELHRRLDA